jgi:asparagine synthase (glutamine-hydrolysing)
MRRIAGLICTRVACPVAAHRLHAKALAARENQGGTRTRHVLTIMPESMAQRPLRSPDNPACQPLWDDEGQRGIVYDGTLYNAADLRAELRSRGRQFHSTSDAEVILQAFAEWDEASFQRLHGLFAMALCDRQREVTYLVRDPFGQKPLYYMADDGHLFFASELGAFIRLKPSIHLNKQGLLEWLFYRNLASDVTFFEDVLAVRPGHRIKFGGGRLEAEAYALLTDYVRAETYERFSATSDALVVRELEGALVKSVQDCLTGDGPIGTCCSGGVDSSLVTALASRSVGDLAAFHASAIDHEALDERRYAEEVAKVLGIPLVCRPVDQTVFRAALVRVISLNGMPLAHIHLVAFYLLVKQAHERGVRVLLTGDAADGQFGGLWHRHRRQPQLRWAKRLFAHLPRRLRNALTLAAHLHGGMPFAAVGIERLIPSAVQSLDGYARHEARLRLERAYAFVPDEESRAILVTMVEDFMDSWDLDRADRLGMGVGVECRSLFVHPDLVSLSFNLPLRYRFRSMTDKWLLKKIATRYLPRHIVYSRKRPWDFPWREYLAPFARVSAFRGGFCTDVLRLSTLAVEELIASWESDVQVFWNLLNLEIWGRLFFLRTPPERVVEVFAASEVDR